MNTLPTIAPPAAPFTLPTAEPGASPAAPTSTSQPTPPPGLTRNHHAGWSGARSVEAAILAVVDGAADRAIWVICDHPTEGSAVYGRVVIGHGYDPQCGWRWRWCGEGDEPWSASSSTICESDAQRGGETTCIAVVAAHLAATAERLRWTTCRESAQSPWIYRQSVEPGPRAPGL